jgi:hypothetical protein
MLSELSTTTRLEDAYNKLADDYEKLVDDCDELANNYEELAHDHQELQRSHEVVQEDVNLLMNVYLATDRKAATIVSAAAPLPERISNPQSTPQPSPMKRKRAESFGDNIAIPKPELSSGAVEEEKVSVGKKAPACAGEIVVSEAEEENSP